MDELQTIEITTALPAVGCLVCSFTLEALVDAICAGTFAFCQPHMLRAAVYSGEHAGERQLHALPHEQ